MTYRRETQWLELPGRKLHITGFLPAQPQMVVAMVHGSMGNSKIFFTHSGKGLAPHLAKHHIACYALDLPGMGKSKPHARKRPSITQMQVIKEDLPAFIEWIRSQHAALPFFTTAHSWGGVLLLASYALHPWSFLNGFVFFGTKRTIRVQHLQKWFAVDLMWRGVGRLAARWKGYLPAKGLKFGSDDEPAGFYRETVQWVVQDAWTGPDDGFDYGRKLRELNLPPALYFSGKNDRYLGHPADVQRLIEEINHQNARHVLLSEENGYKLDYDHVNMLTASEARQDHFPLALQWIQEHST